MEILVREQGAVRVLEVQGEMDLYNAPRLREMFDRLMERKVKGVIVSLDRVEYLDSTGVGVLIATYTLARKGGVGFYLTGVHGTVKRVLELTRLCGFFPIRGTVQQALQEGVAADVRHDPR
jgi:anti-sigma B factor antagonist